MESEKISVEDIFGNVHQLTKELSRGGQGVVYRTAIPDVLVKLDLQGDMSANERYMELRLLPLPQGIHITLPLAPLKDDAGYIMRLLEDMIPFAEAFGKSGVEELDEPHTRFIDERIADGGDIANFFVPLVANGGMRRVLLAYLQAATVLAELHASGFVYCDFSYNNAFVSSDKDHCNVWLIDADNIAPAKQASSCYLYTGSVGAPEVASGQRGDSFASDVFAMASSLFQQITHAHPFEGSAFNEVLNDGEEEMDDVEQRRNAGDFPYIMANEEENDSELNDVYRILMPANLLILFDRTFGAGQWAPKKRPVASEWAAEIALGMDSIIHCAACGMDYPFSGSNECPWCGAKQPILVVRAHNDSIFWLFAHEIEQNNPVSVPLRIVHGHVSDEIFEELFRVKWNEDGLRIDVVQEEILCMVDNATRVRRVETEAVNYMIHCRDNVFGFDCTVDFEVIS